MTTGSGSDTDSLRQAEVENLDLTIGCHLHVGRLQVAMHDAPLVRRFETVGDLRRHGDRVVDRDRAAREPRSQILAVDILHDQRERRGTTGSMVELDDAVNLRDAGVIEGGERLRLAFEPGEAFGIGRNAVGEDLQRDFAIELRVARAEHLAHSARPEHGQNLVVADARSRYEAHRPRDRT